MSDLWSIFYFLPLLAVKNNWNHYKTLKQPSRNTKIRCCCKLRNKSLSNVFSKQSTIISVPPTPSTTFRQVEYVDLGFLWHNYSRGSVARHRHYHKHSSLAKAIEVHSGIVFLLSYKFVIARVEAGNLTDQSLDCTNKRNRSRMIIRPSFIQHVWEVYTCGPVCFIRILIFTIFDKRLC